jgi:hypothetical protein
VWKIRRKCQSRLALIQTSIHSNCSPADVCYQKIHVNNSKPASSANISYINKMWPKPFPKEGATLNVTPVTLNVTPVTLDPIKIHFSLTVRSFLSLRVSTVMFVLVLFSLTLFLSKNLRKSSFEFQLWTFLLSFPINLWVSGCCSREDSVVRMLALVQGSEIRWNKENETEAIFLFRP